MDNHTSNTPPQQPGDSNGLERDGTPPVSDTAQADASQPLKPRLDSSRSPLPRRTQVAGVSTAGDRDQGIGHPRNLVISAIALTIALSAVMSLSILPGQVEITPGMPSQGDILSPVYLSFPSKVLTDKARDKAMEDPANEVWEQDTAVVQSARSMLLN